jgi:hypothetical protein
MQQNVTVAVRRAGADRPTRLAGTANETFVEDNGFGPSRSCAAYMTARRGQDNRQ